VVDVEGAAPTTTFKPSTPGTPGPVYRCPAGSPAKTLGSFVSKRPLSAGCMVPTDPSYDALAEVHVPEYCSTTFVDYMKGCMLPSALNFDPAAKQVGVCKFPTKGCASPTALNYNSFASMAPDAGMGCIEPVLGCTIAKASYAGVDSNTPAYKSGFYGAAGLGNAGGEAYLKVSETAGLALGLTGSSVVSYESAANVLAGCVVAVEGCMDPTAVNYDSKATINTGTWCVPPVYGCMVPSPAYVGPSYITTQPTSTYPFLIPGTVDQPTKSFSTSTTVHSATMCSNARYGCNETGYVNYDPLVTVKTVCYKEKYGCLNPLAVNYGCIDESYNGPCDETEEERVTYHYAVLCRWTLSPYPPPPPAPPIPSGSTSATSVTLKMGVAGTVAEVEAKRDELADTFKTISGLTDSDLAEPVKVTVTDGGGVTDASRRRLQEVVSVSFEAVVADASKAEAAASSLSTTLPTAEDATAAFASSGLTVVSAPAVTTTPTFIEGAAEEDNGGMIGGIVGGIGGLLCAIGIFFGVRYMRNKKNKATYPA
jgi:hypothetical protein